MAIMAALPLTSSTVASRTMAAAKARSDGRHRAEQDQVRRSLTEAGEDEDTEAAAADQGGDGRQSDILNEHDANAGQDDRQRERQLD